MNNEPAFPRHGSVLQSGMTLRDYFAAKAMAAMIANPQFDSTNSHLKVAITAYTTADAMLTERAKQ